jgi:serine/threonine protein kinase
VPTPTTKGGCAPVFVLGEVARFDHVMPGEHQTPPTPGPSLRAGQVVAGSYRIERLLGTGGMAAVWEATSLRTGKRVALKAILHAGGPGGAAGAEMLRREARTAGRVNHPNVVNTYDVVEHEGSICVVMERLDGESLASYLGRKGRLGVEEAAMLLLPAMRGVAAAHAMGVIHRDLKPRNIFVCLGSDGRILTTKVLDFGISVVSERAWSAPLAAQVLPTHGTPAYMSPEHIQGLADIDARADVYGFGVVFFEVLTGQLPFSGEPGPELLRRILTEPAPRLSSVREDLPPVIVAIVAKALAKEPRDRYTSLEPFITAIEDEILPPSPLPRSMTPLGGVPLYALPEARSRVANPVVQATQTNEPSGSHDASDTREMAAVPAQTEARSASRRIVIIRTAGEAAQPATASPPAASAPAPSAPTKLEATPPRSLRRLVVGLAMFGGMLALVAWLAFPGVPDLTSEPEPEPRAAGLGGSPDGGGPAWPSAFARGGAPSNDAGP